MKAFEIVLNEERNVTLTAYIQDVGNMFSNIKERPAVLVLPGGGYHFCSDNEADPVASAYLQAGFHAFILRYSVNEHKAWPNPLDDYEQAMEMIISKADEWVVAKDKIAVIGFSAGGHLAGCAATLAKHRPNAAILGYPVLTRSTSKKYTMNVPDVTASVDSNTCPFFIFSSRTDDVVPISNSINMLKALDEFNIPFECHIYSFGPHGFSTANSSVQSKETNMTKRIPNWVPDSIGWLKEVLGDF